MFSRLKCASCRGHIEGQYLTVEDQKYHPEHFVCFVCQSILDPGKNVFMHVGNPCCQGCYKDNIAEKCAGCEAGILGAYASTVDGKKFHPSCFRCCVDNHEFNTADDSSMEYFEHADGIYCKAHYEAFILPECEECGCTIMEKKYLSLDACDYHTECYNAKKQREEEKRPAGLSLRPESPRGKGFRAPSPANRMKLSPNAAPNRPPPSTPGKDDKPPPARKAPPPPSPNKPPPSRPSVTEAPTAAPPSRPVSSSENISMLEALASTPPPGQTIRSITMLGPPPVPDDVEEENDEVTELPPSIPSRVTSTSKTPERNKGKETSVSTPTIVQQVAPESETLDLQFQAHMAKAMPWKKVERPKLSLDDVLMVPEWEAQLIDYMEKSFCVENLLFIKAVEHFERAYDPNHKQQDLPHGITQAKVKQVITAMVNLIPQEEHKVYLRTVKNCFSGVTAVSWMVTNNHCKDDRAAIDFGQQLMNLDLIQHTSCSQPFLNSKNKFYRFTDAAKKICELNTPGVAHRRLPSEMQFSDQMEKAAKTIYDTYLDADSPQTVNVDYLTRKNVTGLIAERKIEHSMFQRAYQVIHKMVVSDNFARFATTEMYLRMCAGQELTAHGESPARSRRNTFSSTASLNIEKLAEDYGYLDSVCAAVLRSGLCESKRFKLKFIKGIINGRSLVTFLIQQEYVSSRLEGVNLATRLREAGLLRPVVYTDSSLYFRDSEDLNLVQKPAKLGKKWPPLENLKQDSNNCFNSLTKMGVRQQPLYGVLSRDTSKLFLYRSTKPEQAHSCINMKGASATFLSTGDDSAWSFLQVSTPGDEREIGFKVTVSQAKIWQTAFSANPHIKVETKILSTSTDVGF
eukprot:g75053.t1